MNANQTPEEDNFDGMFAAAATYRNFFPEEAPAEEAPAEEAPMKSMQRPITADRMTELLGQFIILRGGVYANQLVRLNGFYRTPGYLVLQISTKTNPRTVAQMSTSLDKIAIIPDQVAAAAAFND